MNTEKQIKNYIQRQINWVKANDLKPGDKVLIRKSVPDCAGGWSNRWVPQMDEAVGKIGTVRRGDHSDHSMGIPVIATETYGTEYRYPYTVLQKIWD